MFHNEVWQKMSKKGQKKGVGFTLNLCSNLWEGKYILSFDLQREI